jgi:hypothetical protein
MHDLVAATVYAEAPGAQAGFAAGACVVRAFHTSAAPVLPRGLS